MKRAVFLDRDGVINRKLPEGQYVTEWEDLEILTGVPEAVALLVRAGYVVLVVTNQRCVAKGLLTPSELDSIHDCMCRELAAAGGFITGVYYCPHEILPPCGCRKPAPGMLLTAARDHEIDLAASWMIGDSQIDIQAGKVAGCRTVQIQEDGNGDHDADLSARSLLEGVYSLLAYS